MVEFMYDVQSCYYHRACMTPWCVAYPTEVAQAQESSLVAIAAIQKSVNSPRRVGWRAASSESGQSVWYVCMRDVLTDELYAARHIERS